MFWSLALGIIQKYLVPIVAALGVLAVFGGMFGYQKFLAGHRLKTITSLQEQLDAAAQLAAVKEAACDSLRQAVQQQDEQIEALHREAADAQRLREIATQTIAEANAKKAKTFLRTNPKNAAELNSWINQTFKDF